MSSFGYKRTSSRLKSMSALPPGADIPATSADFRVCQTRKWLAAATFGSAKDPKLKRTINFRTSFAKEPNLVPGHRGRPPEQRIPPGPPRGLRGIPNLVLDVVYTRHERD